MAGKDKSDRRNWLEPLREFFIQSGQPLPDEIACLRPFVYLDLAPDDFARKCGELLLGTNLLFRRGREIGTVDEAGEWVDMTPDRLRTWLPSTAGVIPFKESDTAGMPIKTGIPVELARAVLASDEFRVKLPDLVAVNPVRMPVYREELDDRGLRKMELLPLGYDVATKTFTVHQGPEFDEDLDPNEGARWLRDLLKYFAFSDKDRLAVQIAAMLTIFGKGLFHGRSPMFLWNSNLAGSGKSRLSQLALDPVFGAAGKSGYSYESRDEVKKELDAAAQIYAPYVWFDDVPKGTVRNTDLNRWLTAKTWSCRILGTKNLFKGPILAATMMTGAQIELDSMIARRTLVIDLFPRQKSRNRALPADAIPLNDDFFESEEMRGKVLASLWGLIRHWDEMGRPGLDVLPDLAGESPLESFENWSMTIAPIVSCASFGNALKSFVAPDAGDTESREWDRLAMILIQKHCAGRDSAVVTSADVIAAARLNGLFVDPLRSLDDVVQDLDRSKGWTWKISDQIRELEEGPSKDRAMENQKALQAAGWSDKVIQSAWGKKFRKSAIFGQLFNVDGEVWEFGQRDSRTAQFPITKIKEPPKMGVL